MIGTILDLILGPLGAILGAIVGAAVLFFGGKSVGKKGAENDAMRDAGERTERGRDAVRTGRGDDPSERLRRNDGKW